MNRVLYSVCSLLPAKETRGGEESEKYRVDIGDDAADVPGLNLAVAEFLLRFAGILVEVRLKDQRVLEMTCCRRLDRDEREQLNDLVRENGYTAQNFELPPLQAPTYQGAGAAC